jgi:hypothetical protein
MTTPTSWPDHFKIAFYVPDPGLLHPQNQLKRALLLKVLLELLALQGP